jgi:hypothetical protein
MIFKKAFSLLLSVVITLSLLSSTIVFAETDTTTQDESTITQNSTVSDETTPTESVASVEDILKEYVFNNLTFTDDWYKEQFMFTDFGKYKDYEVCCGGSNVVQPWEPTAKIGNYTFKLITQMIDDDQLLGLYLIKDNEITRLEDAYKTSLINDTDMDNIIELIKSNSDYEKHFYIYNDNEEEITTAPTETTEATATTDSVVTTEPVATTEPTVATEPTPTHDIYDDDENNEKAQIEIFSNDTFKYSITTLTSNSSKTSFATFDKILDKNIKEFTIPDKIDGNEVRYIHSSAFKNCKKLQKITISKNVVSIGAEAFKGCTSLKNINLKEVTYIGDECFSGCKSLTKIDLTKGEYSTHTEVDTKAFYNCKNLKTVKIYEENTIGKKAFGYYKKGNKEYAKVKGFKLNVYTCDPMGDDDTLKNVHYYCQENKINYTYNLKSKDKGKIYMQTGFEGKIKVDNKSLSNWTSSNSKVVKIDNKGNFVILKEGSVTIKAVKANGKKYTKRIVVKDNTRLTSTAIAVKKGSTLSVRLYGKANSIDNIYTNTKYAKIISKKSATKITVKGLKKGTSTVKIKVNGVKTLKLKVFVN